MSIDIEADGFVRDVPSPIKAGPRPPTPLERVEGRVNGLEAGVALLLDEVTNLRKRVAGLEERPPRHEDVVFEEGIGVRIAHMGDDIRSLRSNFDLVGDVAHDLRARVAALEAQQSDDGR